MGIFKTKKGKVMRMNNNKIVVIGDVFADMTAHVQGFPEKGGRTFGTSLTRNGGGTAGNIAAGLSVLGMDTCIICGTGQDETGDFLLNELEASGVDIIHVNQKENMKSGVVTILVDTDGEREIFVLVQGSAYESIEPEDVRCLEKIKPDVICFTGVMIGAHPAQETVLETAARWKGRARLYFDPNLCYPADRVPEEIGEGTRQLADLCDVVLTGTTEMKALGLRPREGQNYIVKCGGEGSMLLDQSGEFIYRIPATSHRPADTTGAGDAFMAAYVAACTRGSSTEEAMRFASVAAGISVTKTGARNMPGVREIESYLTIYENELASVTPGKQP